jgi:hypothetical protein
MDKNDYWKYEGTPAVFELRKLLDGISSENLSQIIEAIATFDCKYCLMTAKQLIYAEVTSGKLSKLEGFLLDSLLKESADCAINFWIQECIETHESDENDKAIREYVVQLEAFWTKINTSIEV